MKTMNFNCPACGQTMEALSTMAGHWTNCTACGQQFQVRKQFKLLPWLLLLAAIAVGVAITCTIVFSSNMDKLTQ